MPGGSALVVSGNLRIGASSGTAVDVSGVVRSFRISGGRDMVDVPPTLTSTVRTQRAGFSLWTIELELYSNPDATSALYLARQMKAALSDTAASPAGSLYYEGTLGAGAASTSNPKYSGRFIVSGLAWGGTVGEVSLDSRTHPLTDAPTEAFS